MRDYLGPQDAFHAALKEIRPARPRFLHDHDFYELMVVLDGPLRHETPTRAVALPAGSAVFLRPEHVHLIHGPRGGSARVLNVMLRPETVAALGARHRESCAGRFFWSDAAPPETRLLPPGMRGRLAGGGGLLATGPATLLRLEAFVLPLLAELIADPVALDPGLPRWLAGACRAAQSPDVFRDGAAGLARVAGRSHAHLCRAMRRHLGTTPSAWVNGVRMEHAARLIRESAMPVAEVAETVGIGNVGHFYRLFRECHGTTPRGLRRRANNAPV